MATSPKFQWPNLEMEMLRVTELPSDPYQSAKDLGLSIDEYREWLGEAILRESTPLFDTLGFRTEQTEKAKELMPALWAFVIAWNEVFG